MTRFASEKHIASWAGVCPGNKQSGGKRLSGKTTKGNPYLRAILCEVAWAIAHTKDNSLSAFYHRIARRHGKPKAIMALSRHPCWSSFITSCGRRNPTPIWVLIILINEIGGGLSVTIFIASNNSAIQ
jgi:transposase